MTKTEKESAGLVNFNMRIKPEKQKELFELADKLGTSASSLVRTKVYEMLVEAKRKKAE